MIASMLLLTALLQGHAVEPEEQKGRLWVDLGLAGQWSSTSPNPGINSQFQLPWCRGEIGLSVNEQVSGRVAVDTVRSAAEVGYIGIDGESYIPRVQIAEAEVSSPKLGLSLRGGLIDDPWVVQFNRAWNLRSLARGVAEENGWFDRSDLGVALVWTPEGDAMTVWLTMSSGEGLTRRERNAQADWSGLVTVRPLTWFGDAPAERLEVSVFGRLGARGLQAARNHRLGLRVMARSHGVRVGAERTQAWGVQGDASWTPSALSGWIVAEPWGPLLGVVRADAVSDQLGNPDSRSVVLRFGGGVRLPVAPARRHGHVLVALERRARGAQAMPVTGHSSRVSHTVLVQVGVNVAVEASVRGVDDG